MAVTFPDGGRFDEFTPDWDRLVFASRGAIRVETHQGVWMVPPHRALWVPAGTRHHVEMKRTVSLRTTYFWPAASRHLPRECRVVDVTPLVRELILYVTDKGIRGTLDSKSPSDRHVMALLLELIAGAGVSPLHLALPEDPRASRAAALLATDAGTRRTLAGLAREVGASARTLQRLFVAETGMTFEKWRQRARLVRSVELLAEGRNVTTVALEVGYDSPSAFIAVFRRELGSTPLRYLRASGVPA